MPVVPCPAATVIEGSRTGGRAVVCGVMHREFKLLDSILAGDERGVLLTAAEDPSTVYAFCEGEELPLVDIGQDGAEFRAHYSNCPIWQREKARIEVGAEAIFPKPTSRMTAAESLKNDFVEASTFEGRPVAETVAGGLDEREAIEWLMD